MIERVIALVERETGEAGLGAETRLGVVIEESLEFLELLLAVQKEFGCNIPDALVPKLDTIADLALACEGKLAA